MIRKFWKEFIFFPLLTAYFIVGVAPDMTWLSLGGDAFDYVIGAEHGWAVRPTGYPTYIMLGWVFGRIPGNPFWTLGLISAFSSAIACLFIYLTIKYLTTNKWAPYIGAVTFAASFLVWSQSVIPEVYTFTTMLMVIMVYFAIRGSWYKAAIALAFCLGAHLCLVFAAVPLVVYFFWERRKHRVTARVPILIGILVLGLLPYLQTQLVVRAVETTTGLGTVVKAVSNSVMLVFGLPLTKTWDRVTEAVPIIVTGFGFGMVFWFYLKRSKIVYLMAAVVVFSTADYFFSNIPQWITYMVPAMAFGAILIGMGADRFPYRRALPLFFVVPIIFMGLNLIYYDIGRTTDKPPSGARTFYESLEMIPDDAVLYICEWGEPWLVTYYYWVENDRRFHFMFEGEFRFNPDYYTSYQESQGLEIPDDLDKYGERTRNDLFFSTWDADLFIEDFAMLNPDKDVYVVTERDGETFEDIAFGIGRYERYVFAG